MRRALAERTGKFRTECNASQDYDYILRAVERTKEGNIRRILHILYHWRAHRASTASSKGAKTYTQDSGALALRGYLRRTRQKAKVAREELQA